MENPPQMTWQSLLRQRFYDALNTQSTEGETMIIEMALKEMEAAFDKVRAEAKKEVIEEIKREVEANKERGYIIEAALPGIFEKILALSPPSGGTK